VGALSRHRHQLDGIIVAAAHVRGQLDHRKAWGNAGAWRVSAGAARCGAGRRAQPGSRRGVALPRRDAGRTAGAQLGANLVDVGELARLRLGAVARRGGSARGGTCGARHVFFCRAAKRKRTAARPTCPTRALQPATTSCTPSQSAEGGARWPKSEAPPANGGVSR
jgi:hypothetical protein